MVPRQRVSHKPGKPRRLPDDGLLHLAGAVAVGQVQQDDAPARPLHQRAYGALARCARYEVAFPVARHGAVLHLGRPLGDHRHRLAEARLARVGDRPRPAGRAPAAQLLGDIALELPLRLDVDGLVMVSVDAFMPSLSGYSAASLRSSSLRGLGRLRLAAAISPAL